MSDEHDTNNGAEPATPPTVLPTWCDDDAPAPAVDEIIVTPSSGTDD